MPPRARREEPRTPRAGLVLVLALALGLQFWTWGQGRGYPLADSVEYLERAQLVLAGEELSPESVRSFGFSALLVPLVWLLRALGEQAIVAGARLFTMGLGLASVAVVARLTTRLYGPRAGLAAAFALAVNPIFLQWTVEPLAGTAAMLCVALAACALDERGGFRRGLLVGAFLGLALVMAFQSLAVLLVVVALLAARDRWKGRAHTLGVATAIAAALLLLATLDKIVYGSFGSSLWEYVKENVAGTLSSKLFELSKKTGSETLRDLAIRLYNAAFDATNRAGQEAGIEIRHRFARTWYVAHLHSHLFAWPLLLLLGLGVLRSLRRPRWTTAILLLTAAGNATAMSFKGEQSFRLWLPLLPLLVPFAGAGFALLFESRRWTPALRLLGLALLAVGGLRGLAILQGTNLRKHGGYWDAMELVQARRAAAPAPSEQRLAAGYHWATLMRSGGPGLTQVKLNHPLYGWPKLQPEERAQVLAQLASFDWFVSHVQLFEQDPELCAVLAERFVIEGAFYDAGAYEELQPIFVFRRAEPQSPGRRLFTVQPGAEPGALQASLSHPRSFDLRRRFDDGGVDQLVLLGWDAEVLPGSGTVGWLTLSWYAGPTHGRDYTINTRITDPDDRARQVNRAPCWGAHPTSTWQEGWIVRDGMPFALSAGWDDLGGDYCRGDLLPLRLWLAAPRYEVVDGRPQLGGGLSPFHPSGARPVHKERREGRLVSDEGYVFSTDNLVLLGGFYVPVPPAARVPDDGRPLASHR
jgi:hypothetical protein